jgi:hypothetical protein
LSDDVANVYFEHLTTVTKSPAEEKELAEAGGMFRPTGYEKRLINLLIFGRASSKKKGLASLQGRDSARQIWLPELGSNQRPTD